MSHANRGKEWEARLDSQHELYQWRGIAYCQRNHPPIKVLGRWESTTFHACWAGAGPPDYTIVSAGVTFVADAKSCGGERWALSNVHEHQAEAMTAANKAGAIGLILLWHHGVSRCYALLWRDMDPLWRAWKRANELGRAPPGTASLAADGLAALACWSGRSWDWLPGVLAALDCRRAPKGVGDGE